MNRQHHDEKVQEFLEAAGAVPDPKMTDIYPKNVPLFPQYTLFEERLKSFTRLSSTAIVDTRLHPEFSQDFSNIGVGVAQPNVIQGNASVNNSLLNPTVAGTSVVYMLGTHNAMVRGHSR